MIRSIDAKLGAGPRHTEIIGVADTAPADAARRIDAMYLGRACPFVCKAVLNTRLIE